jgi:signal peptidase I
MTTSAWRTALIAAVAALALALTGAFVAEPVRVPSDSMTPTLHRGDQLLVDKLTLRDAGVRRGDLVVFTRPGVAGLIVKRVAGLGGERVAIEDGILTVDDHRVIEPYLDQSRVDGLYFGPFDVPADTVFVLGDNRAESVDSRVFGPVPVADLTGRVSIRLWPPAVL